jgi:SAM-dependent methyltransferase
METRSLKKYAPEARRDFIAAVKNKGAVYGLLPKQILPMDEEGDVVIIGDRPFPRTVAKQRKELEARIRKEGFQQFIEAVAYTWFNRFVAIRYMELHGYLDHGYRVLSHPEGKSAPEILENAERVELPGLNRDDVVDLKLDGGKDEQLYQMLLLAQCNALHKAMPFLFESIKDGTELLLPDNLLHTDSLVRTLVNDIPEQQWGNVEIIGWLYQFYISEKKDQVIGKVVKSEDIPAATQLFTPNWIVRYMLHNTLGRKWMATYPDSPLRQQMEFYIEPAEQTPAVQKQLDEITPTSLNPEELTLLDPACGSGHILVEAYDLFKAIYEERGYRARDIPQLILSKNLFGLEIDERAAQLAAFALMMKARADDRSLFARQVKPFVLPFIQTDDLEADDVAAALNLDLDPHLAAPHNVRSLPDSVEDVTALLSPFRQARTLGSLIMIPDSLKRRLPALEQRVTQLADESGGLFGPLAANVMPLVTQAAMLARQYTCVVANPPFMGSRYSCGTIKEFARHHYKDTSSDLFSMFIARTHSLSEQGGHVGLVTPFVWLFISTYAKVRESLLSSSTIASLIQLEYNAFEPACVPVCTLCTLNTSLPDFEGTYIKLSDFKGHQSQAPKTLEAIADSSCSWRFSTSLNKLRVIPGVPIAYWVSDAFRHIFDAHTPIESLADITASQNITGENATYLRLWWETPLSHLGPDHRWVLYAKGGVYRKWYGNLTFVVDWSDSARDYYSSNGTSNLLNADYWYREGVTYNSITSTAFSARFLPEGCVYDKGGPSLHPHDSCTLPILSVLNSEVASRAFQLLNPTLNFQVADVKKIPIPLEDLRSEASLNRIRSLIRLSRDDWDATELSVDFQRDRIVDVGASSVSLSCQTAIELQEQRICEVRRLEGENDAMVAEAFRLSAECPEVNPDITLHPLDAKELVVNLLSYAVGCIMGRYSISEPGVVYAEEGGREFDASRYGTFSPDSDGIVPVTRFGWFTDDAANRLTEFLQVVWGNSVLDENIEFVANTIGVAKGESQIESIRRYFSETFYKDHLQQFKGTKHPPRPIYWMFSSGKLRAFQCLVYLHRYNAGTLSRMRTEYVVKLQGKINARIEQLESDIPSAGSTSHRKKLEKERDTLVKQREELQTFDEKLRHYADQRIELDLDDGVKVNYGKFGDLLAEVKAITGEKPS